jgi:hypothetical protein
VAAADRVRVTLYLDEPLAEWGKSQGSGLSDLVRRLLADARTQQEGGADAVAGIDPYPVELRADYRRLIDRKLHSGLTREEESELAEVRAQINAFDRVADAWRRRQAAAAVDRELTDLRAAIEALPVRAEGERDADLKNSL